MARTASATVTVHPIQTTNLEATYPDMFTIDEDGPDERDSDHQAAGPDVPRTLYQQFQDYPVYAGLQTAPGRVPGTPPSSALNMPRRLSNSSSSGNSPSSPSSTMFSRESIRSELQRSSSWGSKTSYDSFESAGHWKSIEYGHGHSHGYRMPEPPKRRRTLPQPDEIFATLPAEVLELILDNLKQLHLGKGSRSKSCATCCMRDLCCISLASRKWRKFAQAAL